MTKYLGGSFSSPANNSNFRDNYESIFAKDCLTEGCNSKALTKQTMCRTHLEKAGIIEVEKPETD